MTETMQLPSPERKQSIKHFLQSGEWGAGNSSAHGNVEFTPKPAVNEGYGGQWSPASPPLSRGQLDVSAPSSPYRDNHIPQPAPVRPQQSSLTTTTAADAVPTDQTAGMARQWQRLFGDGGIGGCSRIPGSLEEMRQVVPADADSAALMATRLFGSHYEQGPSSGGNAHGRGVGPSGGADAQSSGTPHTGSQLGSAMPDSIQSMRHVVAADAESAADMAQRLFSHHQHQQDSPAAANTTLAAASGPSSYQPNNSSQPNNNNSGKPSSPIPATMDTMRQVVSGDAKIAAEMAQRLYGDNVHLAAPEVAEAHVPMGAPSSIPWEAAPPDSRGATPGRVWEPQQQPATDPYVWNESPAGALTAVPTQHYTCMATAPHAAWHYTRHYVSAACAATSVFAVVLPTATHGLPLCLALP